MRRKVLVVIVLSTAVNATLVAAFGFTVHNEECDVSARGLVVWSDNRGQLGLPRDQWVRVEPGPKDAVLPPCRVGTKPGQPEFRPV